VTSTSTAPPTTTVAQGNWWDTWGTPEYGGSITIPITALNGTSLDNIVIPGVENCLWFESLFEPDPTVSTDKWPLTTGFVADKYWSGNLAESWEITDTQTITVQLRKGVHWQDKSPVNGREFTAYDVQKHYERLLVAPFYSFLVTAWDEVTAIDTYTVVFKFKQPSSQYFQAVADLNALNEMEAPEWAALPDAERQDWHNAVGTGPWIINGFIDGSSFSFENNPDYWKSDPRYPQNKLPYADKLTLLVIPDTSTQVAALRTGKIDEALVTIQQYTSLTKSSPDLQSAGVSVNSHDIVFNMTQIPFKDIRVRTALQMSINRDTIAKNYYSGLTDGLPAGLWSQSMKGYAYAYADWPQSLKDDYTYNPTGAKALLKEAGFPNGFDTNIYASSAQDLNLLQIYKAFFADIGVNADIQTMDSVSYDAFTRVNKYDQMAFVDLATSMSPTMGVGTFYSKQSPIGAVNDSTYDALYEQYFSNTDSSKTASIMVALDKQVIEQHWVVTSCGEFQFRIWQSYLKGYRGDYLGFGQGLIYARLWIAK